MVLKHSFVFPIPANYALNAKISELQEHIMQQFHELQLPLEIPNVKVEDDQYISFLDNYNASEDDEETANDKQEVSQVLIEMVDAVVEAIDEENQFEADEEQRRQEVIQEQAEKAKELENTKISVRIFKELLIMGVDPEQLKKMYIDQRINWSKKSTEYTRAMNDINNRISIRGAVEFNAKLDAEKILKEAKDLAIQQTHYEALVKLGLEDNTIEENEEKIETASKTAELNTHRRNAVIQLANLEESPFTETALEIFSLKDLTIRKLLFQLNKFDVTNIIILDRATEFDQRKLNDPKFPAFLKSFYEILSLQPCFVQIKNGNKRRIQNGQSFEDFYKEFDEQLNLLNIAVIDTLHAVFSQQKLLQAENTLSNDVDKRLLFKLILKALRLDNYLPLMHELKWLDKLNGNHSLVNMADSVIRETIDALLNFKAKERGEFIEKLQELGLETISDIDRLFELHQVNLLTDELANNKILPFRLKSIDFLEIQRLSFDEIKEQLLSLNIEDIFDFDKIFKFNIKLLSLEVKINPAAKAIIKVFFKLLSDEELLERLQIAKLNLEISNAPLAADKKLKFNLAHPDLYTEAKSTCVNILAEIFSSGFLKVNKTSSDDTEIKNLHLMLLSGNETPEQLVIVAMQKSIAPSRLFDLNKEERNSPFHLAFTGRFNLPMTTRSSSVASIDKLAPRLDKFMPVEVAYENPGLCSSNKYLVKLKFYQWLEAELSEHQYALSTDGALRNNLIASIYQTMKANAIYDCLDLDALIDEQPEITNSSDKQKKLTALLKNLRIFKLNHQQSNAKEKNRILPADYQQIIDPNNQHIQSLLESIPERIEESKQKTLFRRAQPFYLQFITDYFMYISMQISIFTEKQDLDKDTQAILLLRSKQMCDYLHAIQERTNKFFAQNIHSSPLSSRSSQHLSQKRVSSSSDSSSLTLGSLQTQRRVSILDNIKYSTEELEKFQLIQQEREEEAIRLEEDTRVRWCVTELAFNYFISTYIDQVIEKIQTLDLNAKLKNDGVEATNFIGLIDYIIQTEYLGCLANRLDGLMQFVADLQYTAAQDSFDHAIAICEKIIMPCIAENRTDKLAVIFSCNDVLAITAGVLLPKFGQNPAVTIQMIKAVLKHIPQPVQNEALSKMGDAFYCAHPSSNYQQLYHQLLDHQEKSLEAAQKYKKQIKSKVTEPEFSLPQIMLIYFICNKISVRYSSFENAVAEFLEGFFIQKLNQLSDKSIYALLTYFSCETPKKLKLTELTETLTVIGEDFADLLSVLNTKSKFSLELFVINKKFGFDTSGLHILLSLVLLSHRNDLFMSTYDADDNIVLVENAEELLTDYLLDFVFTGSSKNNIYLTESMNTDGTTYDDPVARTIHRIENTLSRKHSAEIVPLLENPYLIKSLAENVLDRFGIDGRITVDLLRKLFNLPEKLKNKAIAKLDGELCYINAHYKELSDFLNSTSSTSIKEGNNQLSSKIDALPTQTETRPRVFTFGSMRLFNKSLKEEKTVTTSETQFSIQTKLLMLKIVENLAVKAKLFSLTLTNFKETYLFQELQQLSEDETYVLLDYFSNPIPEQRNFKLPELVPILTKLNLHCSETYAWLLDEDKFTKFKAAFGLEKDNESCNRILTLVLFAAPANLFTHQKGQAAIINTHPEILLSDCLFSVICRNSYQVESQLQLQDKIFKLNKSTEFKELYTSLGNKFINTMVVNEREKEAGQSRAGFLFALLMAIHSVINTSSKSSCITSKQLTYKWEFMLDYLINARIFTPDYAHIQNNLVNTLEEISKNTEATTEHKLNILIRKLINSEAQENFRLRLAAEEANSRQTFTGRFLASTHRQTNRSSLWGEPKIQESSVDAKPTQNLRLNEDKLQLGKNKSTVVGTNEATHVQGRERRSNSIASYFGLAKK